MKVLIACEESQRVAIAFRNRGIEAYSCDILDCSGDHPEWHIKDDVLNHLNDGWDLMIAHPPCTYLSNAGAGLDKKHPERIEKRKEALIFFNQLLNANIMHICVENPIMLGIAQKEIPLKYSQIINPFQFGEPYWKRTCLWLKNLPLLKPTNIIEPKFHWINSSSNYRPNNKMSNKGLTRSPIERSKTFKGIAEAMAKQWGDYILSENKI